MAENITVSTLSKAYNRAMKQMRQPYRRALGTKLKNQITPPTFDDPPAIPSSAFDLRKLRRW